jgi:putative tryptophan/tyrosine transport system substrate-binding protein
MLVPERLGAEMRRREFIGLLGGVTVAWPLAVRAQQSERVRRIGVLLAYSEADPEAHARIATFEQGLRELNWINGHNVRIDYRFGAGSVEHMRTNSAELVALKPDVLLAHSSSSLMPLRRETHTIPIVVAVVGDLVRAGFAESLARPGGNITGFSAFEPMMSGKWLELLKEIAPGLRLVMIIVNSQNASQPGYVRTIEATARSANVRVSMPDLNSEADIGPAIDEFAREANGGVIVLPGAFTGAHRRSIIASTARHRLPAIYPFRYYCVDGGLISYGIDQGAIFHRAASYVDRIFKGEKPGDLPIQMPTKFELVLNLKTARTLGLDVPPTLLALADEVIE